MKIRNTCFGRNGWLAPNSQASPSKLISDLPSLTLFPKPHLASCHTLHLFASLEADSGKCKRCHPSPSPPIPKFPSPQRNNWLLRPMLSPTDCFLSTKGWLCMSISARVSRLHAIRAAEWLKGQSMKFKSSCDVYSSNLFQLLGSLLRAWFSIRGVRVGMLGLYIWRTCAFF